MKKRICLLLFATLRRASKGTNGMLNEVAGQCFCFKMLAITITSTKTRCLNMLTFQISHPFMFLKTCCRLKITLVEFDCWWSMPVGLSSSSGWLAGWCFCFHRVPGLTCCLHASTPLVNMHALISADLSASGAFERPEETQVDALFSNCGLNDFGRLPLQTRVLGLKFMFWNQC